jgi:CheY-like chemotaxis protein
VTIVAAIDDLMLSSRVSTAAKAVGVTVRFARTPEAVIEAVRQERPALILLDLNSPRVGALDVVAALRSEATLADIPTIGCVSHVDTATIEAARQAGVGRVLARSAFVEQLPTLLRG